MPKNPEIDPQSLYFWSALDIDKREELNNLKQNNPAAYKVLQKLCNRNLSISRFFKIAREYNSQTNQPEADSNFDMTFEIMPGRQLIMTVHDNGRVDFDAIDTDPKG